MRKILKQRKTTVLQNQKGFTLVEMLIVLVLIGLAVAMMVGIFGSPFTQASIDSAATRVIDDLRAIEAAAQASRSQRAATPADLAALVTQGYLKLTPLAPAPITGAYSLNTNVTAFGASTTAADTVATLTLSGDDTGEICRAINRAAYKAAANADIPTDVLATRNIQCFGAAVADKTALIPVFVN